VLIKSPNSQPSMSLLVEALASPPALGSGLWARGLGQPSSPGFRPLGSGPGPPSGPGVSGPAP